MRFRPLPLAALFVLSLVVRAPAADVEKQGKTVRLLNVGNSFSQNATRCLGAMAKAGGHTLVHGQAVIGGSSMQVHWDKNELHEKDPKDPKGLYTTGKGLKEMLASEPWDFVTIQQSSILSHDVKTYRPYAADLRDFIAKHAPKAELLIHETWAYRADDARFKGKTPKAGQPATREEMYRSLSAAYREIAAELKVRIIPVGDAFNLADGDPKMGFKPDTAFDPKAAKEPALPDQTHSLHVGYKWAKGALQMDGHHANAAGEYLGACVFYEILFNESVVGNSFVSPGLDAEYAKFLRETAHRAVEASRAKRAEAPGK